VRIVFMGTPEFAVPALRHLVLNGHQVAAVYTRPDKPAGRGRQPAMSPVKRAAIELDLSVVQPASLKKAEAVAELAGYKADAVVVAAYGQILPKAVLDTPVSGCINIHPSMLPRHRGASPIVSAILQGDEFTGVSIMLMDEGLDTGPVLTRAQIPIANGDNTKSLTSKLSLMAAHLLQDVLPGWEKGQLKPQPQDEDGATYSGIITKQSGEIDWHKPADLIWRQVRAFHPWPGCYTSWRGKRLGIIEAKPAAEESGAAEGQVVAMDHGGFGVKTGSGVLEVLVVQLEGKREIAADEFLRGQRQLIGQVLPS
jgi:methionyl-tRNA formyltransferase